jgi:uncharacterized protein (UPF0147 family)
MEIKLIIKTIHEVSTERGIPNNVREMLNESADILKNDKTEQERISSVVSILDDASNDPNVPPHIRTRIWNLVSSLESMLK